MPGARGSGRSVSKDGVSMVISLDILFAVCFCPSVVVSIPKVGKICEIGESPFHIRSL